MGTIKENVPIGYNGESTWRYLGVWHTFWCLYSKDCPGLKKIGLGDPILWVPKEGVPILYYFQWGGGKGVGIDGKSESLWSRNGKWGAFLQKKGHWGNASSSVCVNLAEPVYGKSAQENQCNCGKASSTIQLVVLQTSHSQCIHRLPSRTSARPYLHWGFWVCLFWERLTFSFIFCIQPGVVTVIIWFISVCYFVQQYCANSCNISLFLLLFNTTTFISQPFIQFLTYNESKKVFQAQNSLSMFYCTVEPDAFP